MVALTLPIRTLLKPLLFILFCFSASPLFAQTVTYSYDALGRVTFVQDSTNGNRDYDYDAAGNRLLVSASTANDASAEPAPPPPPAAPTNAYSTPYQSNSFNNYWTGTTGAAYYVLTISGNGVRVNANGTNMSYGSATRATYVRACNDLNACSADVTVTPR